MTPRPVLRLTAGLATAALLLLLSGCSDDSAPEAGGATMSPLNAYLDGAGSTYDEAESQRKQVEVENLVAKCMVDAGFEYVPQDVASMSSMALSAEDTVDRDTEEWISSNGYGSWSFAEPTTEPTDDQTQDEWVDPNADYTASLSESALAAYNEALNGPDLWSTMTEEEMENYVYRWQDSGCSGAANNEVYPEIQTRDEFEPLFNAMNDLYEAQRNAPETKALEASWSGCMADAGVEGVATPDAAMELVNTRYSALYENLPQPENPDSPDAVWPEPSPENIKAAKTYDIETALADFRCKKSVKWTETTEKVTSDFEEQFITDHKAELDAYKASLQEDARS